ncbi:polysaccharide biosynthesis protein GumN [Rhizobium sp. P38BS-XIX]|uniref:TraB/GumN family protein n=1 Tax=Rhizobium sp. P38BS-XIX TaxID=2726740 RepID=UPI001456AA1C|nr:TraB/GumN family protein [Rhizobium sp. P38BS-XIX]NLR99134.1 polysaccharide biosynthesis protein GumN [Rhizobium sp. P38BS-XIX]
MTNRSLGSLAGRFRGFASRIAAPLLLSAFLAAPPALADNSGSCGGKDLLMQLRKSDPPRYGAIIDEASKIVNGYSTFWKIQKPGVEPSWLFGTIHSSDERVLNLSPEFQDAFDNIDTLVLELKDISNPNTIAIELLKHPELTMLPPDRNLDQILPAEQTTQVAAGLAKRGVPIASVLRMRPWFIYMSLLVCNAPKNAKGQSFLDGQLAIDAQNNGVDVEGLETPLEQFQAMADLSDELTMKGLLEVFQMPYSTNDMTETLIGLYLTGNSGLMKAFAEGLSDDKALDSAFMKRIVTDRNRVMAKRILPYLERGNVMMAVGALHLPGDQGVVELLRQQGYTLTPVN